jgi:copper ion binding protein
MSNEDKEQKKISIPLTGMSCAACAANIERGLKRVGGVSLANVNFAAEKATVEYDPQVVDEDQLVNTVVELGYGVRTEKASFKVSGITCASCVNTIERALRRVKRIAKYTGSTAWGQPPRLSGRVQLDKLLSDSLFRHIHCTKIAELRSAGQPRAAVPTWFLFSVGACGSLFG